MIEKFTGLGLVMLLAVVSSQGKIFAATKKNPGVVRPKVLAWRQTAEFPHDPAAFTQGFEVWDKNYFLESTGQYGRSEIRRVERRSGDVVVKGSLDHHHFAEGVTRIGEDIFQLTWREGLILRWNFTTKGGFSLKSKSSWSGEAWGLTKGASSLWISDGTSSLYEIDQKTLKIKGSRKVTLAGEEFDKLNELEFVGGKILANVFMSATVVVINPRNGVIESMIDLSSLLPKPASLEAVANGLAWDASKKRLYVTGKYWPKVYELAVDF